MLAVVCHSTSRRWRSRDFTGSSYLSAAERERGEQGLEQEEAGRSKEGAFYM
jgi:hypothetical protein